MSRFFVLVYVDNIIVASSSPSATMVLLRSLEQDFTLNDLGGLHYFLEIEVTKINNGILLSQHKYATELLKRAGMLACKPINTPLSIIEKTAHEGDLLLHCCLPLGLSCCSKNGGISAHHLHRSTQKFSHLSCYWEYSALIFRDV
jgi:hypothetical protein